MNGPEACARWIAHDALVALGEPLGAEDAAFREAHLVTCPACRAESDLWSAMGSMLDTPAAAPSPRSLVVPMRRRWRVRVAAALAVAASAAASVLLLARHPLPAPVAAVVPSAPSAAAPPDARLVLSAVASSGLAVDGRPAAVGQVLARGSLIDAQESAACIALEGGVHACVERGSLVRVQSLGPERRLELLRGRLAAELDPQPPGTSFGVVTRDGSSVAVGTAFSVQVPYGAGPVVTRVLHGTVVVRSLSGVEQRVEAREMTTTSAPSVSSLPLADEARDRALVDFVAPPPVAPPVAASAPARASAPTPAELLVAAREKRGRGDVAGAAAAYRELVERRAASPEAHAALVPYGELLLGDMADARGALALFDRYVRTGGPLDEEASFGRVRALRALGRVADERAAMDAFHTRFPDSPLAGALR